MRLAKTNSALNRRGRAIATERSTALRAATKTGVRQEAEKANARLDEADPALFAENDGAAPLTPENVQVEPLRRALRVTWNPPLEEEYVERTRIRVTNTMSTGRVLVQDDLSGKSATIVDIPLEEHLVEVQFVDRWGLESPWSAWVSATPLPSVADEIDLAAIEIAGKLGWENLEPLTDGANLGNDVVTSRSMATQNFAALSAWVGELAVKDALIGGVKADKIETGTLDVEIALDVGGELTWPGGVLDDGGMTLGDLAKGAGALPDTSPASWITSIDDGQAPSPASGLTFFRGADSGDFRGALLVAQGVRGANRGGMLRFLATNGAVDTTALSVAAITMKSQDGAGIGGLVALRQDVAVARDLSAGRDISAQRDLAVAGDVSAGGQLSVEHIQPRTESKGIGANTQHSWGHGFPNNSLFVQVFYAFGGQWHPAESPGSKVDYSWDANFVYVLNSNDAARDVRIAAWKCTY